MTYALDSNIISYFIRKQANVVNALIGNVQKGHTMIIPPISYYEVRRGFLRNPAPKKEREFYKLASLFGVGSMNARDCERAAQIYADSRKRGRPIEDDDILIAAFCVVNGYTLVTANAKHFDGIDSLTAENWSDDECAGETP